MQMKVTCPLPPVMKRRILCFQLNYFYFLLFFKFTNKECEITKTEFRFRQLSVFYILWYYERIGGNKLQEYIAKQQKEEEQKKRKKRMQKQQEW